MSINRERHQKELDMYGYTEFKSDIEVRLISRLVARNNINHEACLDALLDGIVTVDDVNKEIDEKLKDMFNEAMGDYYDE